MIDSPVSPVSPPSATPARHPFGGIPNLLSLSRLPLSVVLFVCISYDLWAAALLVFSLAMFTDWLDGWWARKYGPLSPIGRSLDPLTDKVIIGGAFIYFLIDPRTGLMPWMVTVVIARELLITGLRGIVESLGKSFGADWFGKLKTVLQSAAVIGVLLLQTLRSWPEATGLLAVLEPIQAVLLYSMLAATIGSAVQYTIKAVRLLK